MFYRWAMYALRMGDRWAMYALRMGDRWAMYALRMGDNVENYHLSVFYHLKFIIFGYLWLSGVEESVDMPAGM